MWGTFFQDFVELLPQLLVTFFGVSFAFALDRLIDHYRKYTDRKDLKHDLHSELEEIASKLVGKGNLHFPDIWRSAISSGQIRLLKSEQVRKLAGIYREVQAIEYEARRARDLGEASRIGSQPPKSWIEWSKISKDIYQREQALKKRIEEVLREKWW